MKKNFYELIPKRKPVHNPGYEKHGLELPFYGLIIGGSGSGKTNVLLQFIELSSKTFTRIVICVKNSDEPLYNLLREKCPEVEFYENGQIPDIALFENDGTNKLIVFDDLVLEKDQSDISEYYIRGRKLQLTCIYLSQSYYKIPKIIRINARYIILKKLSSNKDLKLILSEYNLNYNMEEILQLYDIATKDFTDFLLIDTQKNIFRKNFK
jgi:hypothetical protein